MLLVILLYVTLSPLLEDAPFIHAQRTLLGVAVASILA